MLSGLWELRDLPQESFCFEVLLNFSFLGVYLFPWEMKVSALPKALYEGLLSFIWLFDLLLSLIFVRLSDLWSFGDLDSINTYWSAATFKSLLGTAKF